MLKLSQKFLVIACCGNESLHTEWCSGVHFDTCIVNYGSRNYSNDSKFYIERKGPKFHLIKDALAKISELSCYDYIWMPDDDLLANKDQVNNIFNLSWENNLWISQPSIIGYHHPIVPLQRTGIKIRYTNWVEIMCPCFSKFALNKCKKTFRENVTGWSIDAAWNVILGHPKNKMAILDCIPVIHTRPTGTGDAYANLEKGITAKKDGEVVFEKYNLYEELKKDIGEPQGQGGILNPVCYKKILNDVEKGDNHENKIHPMNPYFKEFIETKRKQILNQFSGGVVNPAGHS